MASLCLIIKQMNCAVQYPSSRQVEVGGGICLKIKCHASPICCNDNVVTAWLQPSLLGTSTSRPYAPDCCTCHRCDTVPNSCTEQLGKQEGGRSGTCQFKQVPVNTGRLMQSNRPIVVDLTSQGQGGVLPQLNISGCASCRPGK